MPRVCEICGRREELDEEEDKLEMEILDVCPECTNDRLQ
ncbi:ribosome-binding protein aMBF1 (putative translation factor) [Bacillus benzoevorans]|uniref:Ribosome-binding protein aMBF1 (Putative translation factor) n=1 Tax=Bacillus benzoevorans TaxID=1456 RepID=A0A7X0HRS8_9BACI|nr:ribosome-binding protein aMBF1 (putative translation factor) [Bacillus benzoevorans]